MKGHWQPFTKEVAAESLGQAQETVLSDFGSKHRVQRGLIKIDKMEEVPLEEVESAVVRWKVGGRK